MKKAMYQFMVIFAVMCIGVNAWAAPPATDVQCNPLGCVNDTDIATDAVTETKIAAGVVTSAKIADGSVTDAKITGPISASKLEKPANAVVVATSGGDFTTISAALSAITPSATNPYIIKVMPGKYTEFVSMKSYVNLVGSGDDVTIIESPSYSNYLITIDSLTNVAISGFTISGGSYGSYGGINISNSAPTISYNIITGHDSGIELYNSAAPLINNRIVTNHYGIAVTNSAPFIKNNHITGQTGYGIRGSFVNSTMITYDNITGNYIDIRVDSGAPNISHNVYDTLEGTTGNGQYNVTSTGDPAPAP